MPTETHEDVAFDGFTGRQTIYDCVTVKLVALQYKVGESDIIVYRLIDKENEDRNIVLMRSDLSDLLKVLPDALALREEVPDGDEAES